MKKFIFLIYCLCAFMHSTAQVFTFQSKPGSAGGEDAYLASFGSSINYGNHPEFSSTGWTCQGNTCIGRGLLRFDLSAIPQNAIVQNAWINLFACTNPINGNGQAMYGTNAAFLYRVTSPWSESLVTFSNQPSFSALSAVFLPMSNSPFQNYYSVDVSNIVSDMIANPSSNFGFLLKLASEQPFASMIFASSDNSDSLLWPEIVVEYTMPVNADTCIVLTSSDINASDAFLASISPLNNFGNHPEFAAISWTCGGAPCFSRGILNFNFNQIPANATIVSANLSLNANPTPSNGNGLAMQGNNSALLQRVVSPWSENSVTWQIQPQTTGQHEVLLPPSMTTFQNYVNINVGNLVKDMFNYPTNSFGFMLKLSNESGYSSMIFSSSDYGNPQLYPTLEICYAISTSLNNDYSAGFDFDVSPNPTFKEVITIKTNGQGIGNMEIDLFTVEGKLINRWAVFKEGGEGAEIKLNLDDLEFDLQTGVHLLVIKNGGFSHVKKVVIMDK